MNKDSEQDTAMVRDERGGFLRLDPVPTDAQLSEFYESRYYDLLRKGGRAPELRKLTEGGERARRELQWLHEAVYEDIALIVRELRPSCSRVLDVGAGTGVFVEFMSHKGFEAEGIEPAIEPSAAARERGLSIATATLSQWAASAHGQYDAVVMLNVLEHVPHPEQTLNAVYDLLKPGGVAVVRVPNDFSEIQAAAHAAIGGNPWWICRPDHINYFSVESLGRFFRHCRFEVERSITDFPMEFFLLMGQSYVGNPTVGAAVHEMRVKFELGVPGELRRKIYTALAEVGVGRNVMAFAGKRG